jgi:hypothetical protein
MKNIPKAFLQKWPSAIGMSKHRILKTARIPSYTIAFSKTQN